MVICDTSGVCDQLPDTRSLARQGHCLGVVDDGLACLCACILRKARQGSTQQALLKALSLSLHAQQHTSERYGTMDVAAAVTYTSNEHAGPTHMPL